MWIARNSDGRLFLYVTKPKRKKEKGEFIDVDFQYMELPKEHFPKVTWDNSPVEYELKHAENKGGDYLKELQEHFDGMTREEIEDELEEIRKYHGCNYDNTLFYYCGDIWPKGRSRYWKVIKEIPYDDYHIEGYLIGDKDGNTIKVSDLNGVFRKIRKNTKEFEENNFEI